DPTSDSNSKRASSIRPGCTSISIIRTVPLNRARRVGGNLVLMATPGGPSQAGAPRLPVRASIYVAPDGTVHFGALFAELLPVAAALGAATATPTATRPRSRPQP